MKIFIISDLHANFEALSLLPSDYDELWVLGDLVNYGPDPALTIEFVRLRASMVVRGNHDNAVGYGSDYRCSPRFQRMAEAMGSYTRSMLSAEDKQYLRGLPACARRRVGSQVFFLCHATPSDLLYDYRLPDFAAVARRRGGQFRRRYNPSRPYSSSIHAHLRIPHGAQSSEASASRRRAILAPDMRFGRTVASAWKHLCTRSRRPSGRFSRCPCRPKYAAI
jgi:predicted phosphodiesterase